MAARFAVVTEEEIAKIKEDSIPKKTKQATKYGLKIFQGKILNFTCFYLEKNWLSRNATHSRVCMRFKFCKQTIYIVKINLFEVNFYKVVWIMVCKHLEIYTKTISRLRLGDYKPIFTSPSAQ